MKKLIFTLFVFSFFFTSAQDTTTVEQYCDLVVTGSGFSNKLNIVLDFGQEKSRNFRDNKLKDFVTGKPREFNTVIDALNYMGVQGWSLINAYPFPYGDSKIYHYYFKKRFKRSDIIE